MNSFLRYLRLTVKFSKFLRLSAKFLAVLRLSVNPIETLIMGYFDRIDDRVTVSLHILYTANQETEGSQDRLTI